MSTADWLVVAASCVAVFAVGLWFARRSSRRGAEGYFAGGRDVPWWAIGLSNTATYQSGNGAFVALIVTYGLAANWLWWSSWIIWMPLVAIVWARLWRRMQIVTTAELISLRYHGQPAAIARKMYAVVCCLGFAVLITSYITGFFAKTIAPLCPLTTTEILFIFGGVTVVYTMFGGLLGVVYSDVVQFAIMLLASVGFLLIAVPQHGGWAHILQRIQETRPEALAQTPPTRAVEMLTVAILVLQGWFFAGSPTAGEGMTAQRFMAARNERHAVGGQLFNAFLALSLRTLPLIGLGLVAASLFWTSDPQARLGPAPAGMTLLDDAAHAWGELVRASRLPIGFVGLLVAAEAAAYMSTLSAVINWGGSFVVNDLLPARRPAGGFTAKHLATGGLSASEDTGGQAARGTRTSSTTAGDRVWVSRLTSLVLFILSAAVTILFVDNMMSWFLFINSVMVIFLLPLAWFRFFWWRFNVWGEMAAIGLGLPLSIVVWFVLDFQARPLWQGAGLLFGSSIALLTAATLLTPPEPLEQLREFYRRCRPPGLWGPVRAGMTIEPNADPSTGRLLADSVIGILACLGLVLATNAIFVGDWVRLAACAAASAALGGWLLVRVLEKPRAAPETQAVSTLPETAG